MGSEVDAEAASATAVDSDGSVSWEDFFGTTTDLVPQLLGMFDELAHRGDAYVEHMVLPSSCSIPAILQKRLSLVSIAHQDSIFDQLCNNTDIVKPMPEEYPTNKIIKQHDDSDVMKAVNNATLQATVSVASLQDECNGGSMKKKLPYRRKSNDLIPFRRCRNDSRPLSASSIASSTSSSSSSNQGNTGIVNSYLASVESLADTCISSQGSADSGVVTISESRCQNNDNNQRRINAEEHFSNNRPRYCDSQRNPVERVLLEIVDTEAIYVEHLSQVIQGYLVFWRDDPMSFMHELQLNDLFSNIEDIFKFNREFLREIEKCGLDPVCVANTFIKHNTGFKVYTEYCTNYPRTVSVLTSLMSQEETASAFRERQAALGHALPLGSYLLKPVQRILKYHLLLENLSKEYDSGYDSKQNETEGRNAIEAALATMTGIAKHINAMKRRHEHAVRVQEIQSLLYGWLGPDLTTSGELIAEGRFRMRGAKALRHAFLFDRMLLLTKKKEDGLLVYKAHIMCSNLMLIESIPGEPLSFHIIPFDNPRLQYTLQARNLEQKREWTLQIKRVILENYNAVIPSHARQLVLQLGQTQQEDDALADKGSGKKHSAPPEYLEKRKQERERRRSENALRQKFKKDIKKSNTMTEDSPASLCKNDNEDINDCREHALNRSSDGLALKVKDRFTGWRRKSEPGFQSYIHFNYSDEEQKEETSDVQSTSIETEVVIHVEEDNKATSNSLPSKIEDNSEQHNTSAKTVEEIVSHILMQNQEFQKLLEKQRTNSIINVRQQRFNNRISADTSDESDSENSNYTTGLTNRRNNNSYKNRLGCARIGNREQRLIKTNNKLNSLSSISTRENQSLELLYDNLKPVYKPEDAITKNNKANHIHEKRLLYETFQRQGVIHQSKVIKTALQIRENATSDTEENISSLTMCNSNAAHRLERKKINGVYNGEESDTNNGKDVDPKGFGNYDNLQHVWKSTREKDNDENDSPTRPAVWLNKLCEGLPTSPLKSGSLPRSFQISPTFQRNLTKSRFLQRDGKPMSERPFTIASDKPEEINLEDMERYVSTCQPEGRIAKFPIAVSNSSSSTFFCSLENTLTDPYSDVHMSTNNTDIYPTNTDHKIYRMNGSAIFKSVLSKAGSRLQGLRNTMSTETLECSEELERVKYFRLLDVNKSKKKSKSKHARESSSDVEELTGWTHSTISEPRVPVLYYKQGSSDLGARIAQSDYADPTILFSESKRSQPSNICVTESKKTESKERHYNKEKSNKNVEYDENETESFYEKSFEIIEKYADADMDEFRDSAIFSDVDDLFAVQQPAVAIKAKVAPPIPAKKRQNISLKYKPNIAQKPDYLKIKSISAKEQYNLEGKTSAKLSTVKMIYQPQDSCNQDIDTDKDDVSVGQSQAGWVRKIVGQLQGRIET